MSRWQIGPMPTWLWAVLAILLFVLAKSVPDFEWVVTGIGKALAAIGEGFVHLITNLRTGSS
jgi:hypothetical protein